MRKFCLIPLAFLALVAVLFAALWLARARLAGEIAQSYFRQHGIASQVSFSRLTLSGVAGRIALGPAEAPDFSAEAVEVDFDPLQFTPRIVALRLVNPVVRARLDENGKLTLPSLQAWLDSLSANTGHSDYVSDDLAISFSHLTAVIATPAGPLELAGDAKLKRGDIVSAAITAKPTNLSWRGWRLGVTKAGLKLDAGQTGYAALIHYEGGLKNADVETIGVTADLAVPSLSWDAAAKSFAAPALTLKAHAASLAAGGFAAAKPVLALTVRSLQGSLTGDFSAVLAAQAGGDFASVALPVLSRDKKLTGALNANLRHLDVAFAARLARRGGQLNFAASQPIKIKGAAGGALTLTAFAFSGTPASLSGNFAATLSGTGLPALTVSSRALRWQDGALTGDAALGAGFDFDMLHSARLTASGAASFRGGVFAFTLGPCAPASLSAFHPGASDLAKDIKGSLCPVPGENTLSVSAAGWKFSAAAKDVAMAAPLATVLFSGGFGQINFSGKGEEMAGKISVATAQMSDGVSPRRFEPMVGNGDIVLDKWVWQGAFAVADKGSDALGTARFRHALQTGEGEVVIDAPNLKFAPGHLQPRLLSPLLGSLTRVEGGARFSGTVSWTPGGIKSGGTLAMDQLDFLTPLGTAHAMKASIALSSLLPPATLPGQHITISKVDWALPLSGIALDFSFGDGALKLENLTSQISEGNIHLGALTLNLLGPRDISGAADLDGISLASLAAAFNLGGKIALDGKVTGKLPFSYGPDGFRIHNGHVQALGLGHIRLDRGVWEAGGATASNAVQDLAYQAMENLAFDQLSADINSIADGRLQIVFHIKGHSDPPHPQQAQVAIADILNGTALQKTIALPSDTPIDLTLDTSLNFDQLLNSYTEAWSKAVGQAGQSN